jgi:2-oxoisovalerate dehydrogenase E1 component alpha subunit
VPTLIEGLTYRLGMHTTAEDGAHCEPPGMRDAWRPRDPIIRLQHCLGRRGVWNTELGVRTGAGDS